MGLFNFDKNCYVCKCHRNRKAVVLSLMFDTNITNSIVSYLSCYSCSEMMKYELEYEKEEYKEYSTEAKLFHFIFNNLDNKYKELKTVKDRKTYMKELVRGSECWKRGMLVKFVKDTYNLRMVDLLKQWFSKNKPNVFYFLYNEELFERFHYRNDWMFNKEVLQHLFYQYN